MLFFRSFLLLVVLDIEKMYFEAMTITKSGSNFIVKWSSSNNNNGTALCTEDRRGRILLYFWLHRTSWLTRSSQTCVGTFSPYRTFNLIQWNPIIQIASIHSVAFGVHSLLFFFFQNILNIMTVSHKVALTFKNKNTRVRSDVGQFLTLLFLPHKLRGRKGHRFLFSASSSHSKKCNP